MAVARAYGVSKIIAFDIDEERVKFANSYKADIGIVCPINKEGKEPLAFSTEFINGIIKEHGLGSGVDLTIEASGAEACVHMGVVITKPAGTCKFRSDLLGKVELTTPDIQAGLGKQLTSVPLFSITAKDLVMKGICFLSASLSYITDHL